MLREDIQYQRGAIDHPGVQVGGESILLRDGQLVVEYNQRRAVCTSRAPDLLHFAFAEEGSRVVCGPLLYLCGDDCGASGAGKRPQLLQGVGGVLIRSVR